MYFWLLRFADRCESEMFVKVRLRGCVEGTGGTIATQAEDGNQIELKR